MQGDKHNCYHRFLLPIDKEIPIQHLLSLSASSNNHLKRSNQASCSKVRITKYSISLVLGSSFCCITLWKCVDTNTFGHCWPRASQWCKVATNSDTPSTSVTKIIMWIKKKRLILTVAVPLPNSSIRTREFPVLLCTATDTYCTQYVPLFYTMTISHATWLRSMRNEDCLTEIDSIVWILV